MARKPEYDKSYVFIESWIKKLGKTRKPKKESKRRKNEEIIRRISEKLGMKQTHVREIFYSLLNEIIYTVVKYNKITMPGFGTFRISHIPAHSFSLPNALGIKDLPAANQVSFAASKNFKEIVNRPLRDKRRRKQQEEEKQKQQQSEENKGTDNQV